MAVKRKRASSIDERIKLAESRLAKAESVLAMRQNSYSKAKAAADKKQQLLEKSRKNRAAAAKKLEALKELKDSPKKRLSSREWAEIKKAVESSGLGVGDILGKINPENE